MSPIIERGSFKIEFVEYTDSGIVLHWKAKDSENGEYFGKQTIDLPTLKLSSDHG